MFQSFATRPCDNVSISDECSALSWQPFNKIIVPRGLFAGRALMEKLLLEAGVGVVSVLACGEGGEIFSSGK